MDINLKWKYGTVLRDIAIPGYEFSETLYPAGSKLSLHSHDFSYLCFVLQGNFKEHGSGGELTHKSTELIFHPLDDEHSNQFLSTSRCFNIKLNSEKFGELADNLPSPNSRKVFKGGKIIHLVSNLYNELRLPDDFTGLAAEGLMLEIFAELFRGSNANTRQTPPSWLKRIDDTIKREYTCTLSITALARSENVHPAHLAREYRRHFNMTIGQRVRKHRIEKATKKLIESDCPINEIALEMGFYDQSHFTRVFKKAIGITPFVYRANFNNR